MFSDDLGLFYYVLDSFAFGESLYFDLDFDLDYTGEPSHDGFWKLFKK